MKYIIYAILVNYLKQMFTLKYKMGNNNQHSKNITRFDRASIPTMNIPLRIIKREKMCLKIVFENIKRGRVFYIQRKGVPNR